MKRRRYRPESQLQKYGKLIKALQEREARARLDVDTWKLKVHERDAELKTLRDTLQRIGRIAQMAGQLL